MAIYSIVIAGIWQSVGVVTVQPGIVKMGGVTRLMQGAATCYARSVELVQHQTQPTIGHAANLHVLAAIMHLTKPAEFADPSMRVHSVSRNPPKPTRGGFRIPSDPSLDVT